MSRGPRTLFQILRTGDGEVHAGLALERVECDDPDVLERWETTDEAVPRQVVTAFRARVRRPAAYPADLPFVPAVRVFVTEMEQDVGRLGARWLVEDESDVLSDVLSALLAEGWDVDPGRELGFPFPGRRIVVRRAADASLLLEARLEDGLRVVQLLPLV